MNRRIFEIIDQKPEIDEGYVVLVNAKLNENGEIEETEEKMLFSKSKGFRITKLKEYDGNNYCEKLYFC